MTTRIGLIAGGGRFPFCVAEEVKRRGNQVVVAAIHGMAEPELGNQADRFEWIRLGELGRLIRFFETEKVEQSVMAGKIAKCSLFSGRIRPDLEMVKALASIRDWKDDSLLGAISRTLEKKGIQVLPSTAFLTERALPESGVLTRRKPSLKEMKDIEFGWPVAKELARLDIGQTVVVKERAVLSLEAIEGTDEAIRRGGSLGGEGTVVIKVAKPHQDMRYDVPVIGVDTVKTMVEVKARCLAAEAGKTIVVERDSLLEKANRAGIAIILRGSD